MDRFVTDPCPKSLERPRVGILGGTFDPVHKAHVHCAMEAKEALGLDKVLLIPAARPSFKRDLDLADFSDRAAMCELAIKGKDGLEVSRMEGDRPGISYTIDTLEELMSSELSEAKTYFLIGSDAFEDLGKWKRFSDVVKLVEFAVFMREEDNDAHMRALANTFGATAQFIPCERMDVSSSEIRRRLRSGASLNGMVDDAVLEYIEEKGLYRD